jgi:hypothetical protein
MDIEEKMHRLPDEGKAIIDCCALEHRARTPNEHRRLGEIQAELLELREEHGHQKGVDGFFGGTNAEEIDQEADRGRKPTIGASSRRSSDAVIGPGTASPEVVVSLGLAGQ